MSKLIVAAFALSLDGFGSGPAQDRDHPLGRGGEALHRRMTGTATFHRKVIGWEGGGTGVDDRFAARSFAGIGAWIMGRHMFGPVRGPWPDETWKGWWGDTPPYGAPVFVLTHHPRPSFAMRGGTVFHFVTCGIEAALDQARMAAAKADVRLRGGVATVRQHLAAGLVDEMHLVVSPILLGLGEALMQGIDVAALGFTVAKHVASEHAMHVVLARRS